MNALDLLSLLRSRYAKRAANGPTWAFIEQVRNAAGFNATRTADAIAMALWPSRGLELHGFEIKVSRSDWLRELKDPSKAVVELVDRWWIVAPESVVHPSELLPSWGLLVARNDRWLVSAVRAERLRGPSRCKRRFDAATLPRHPTPCRALPTAGGAPQHAS